MQITKEWIEAQERDLTARRYAAEVQVHLYDGALQALGAVKGQMDAPEEALTLDGLKDALGADSVEA